MKNRKKNDWVTAVISDLKSLDIKLEFEQIKTLNKSIFMRIVKEKIKSKTLENMKILKASHSKVKHIEHENIRIQKYLLPNSCKITKEDAQLIFHLRCRNVKIKQNMKGMFDEMNCRACGLEEETQMHIIQDCKTLNKNNGDMNIKYEKLFNGTVSEKLLLAKIFKENYEVIENMKK